MFQLPLHIESRDRPETKSMLMSIQETEYGVQLLLEPCVLSLNELRTTAELTSGKKDLVQTW